MKLFLILLTILISGCSNVSKNNPYMGYNNYNNHSQESLEKRVIDLELRVELLEEIKNE